VALVVHCLRYVVIRTSVDWNAHAIGKKHEITVVLTCQKTYVPIIPSMAYAPQPTKGQIDHPKAQIQLIVMMVTARSAFCNSNTQMITFLLFVNNMEGVGTISY
jgi:hypothetical protein